MPTLVDYDLYQVPPRWLFLRITTDDGLVGWGEATVPSRLNTVSAAVSECFDQVLKGRDALRIEDHWQTMFRSAFHRGGPILMSAIGGIDQALWDIKGKHYGAPVYELLGGRSRNQIRTYRYIGGETVEDVCEQAENAVDDGWTALKMHATPKMRRIDKPRTVEDAARRLREVREAVGPDVDVAVDCHGRVSRQMAPQVLDALEPHRPMFVEEPVLPEYSALLPSLASETSVPVAAGERLYNRFEFHPVFEGDAIDVVQPHVCMAGGVTESQKIASMADSYDVGYAPNHDDGSISFVACLHLCLNAPNAVILDVGSHNTTFSYFDDSPVEFDGDRVSLAAEPGLGFDVDVDHIGELSERSIDWQFPIWRHDDDSVAEW